MALFGARRPAGWAAIAADGNDWNFAHGLALDASARPQIARADTRPLELSDDRGLKSLVGAAKFAKTPAVALLKPGEYQLLLVEAPGVDESEVAEAIRWQVKDLLETAPEQTYIDFLEVPFDAADPLASRYMYAVACSFETIERYQSEFAAAGASLCAIDIRETAQRNLNALVEDDASAAALLHMDEETTLLTVTYGGELAMVRRIELGLAQFANGEASSPESIERLVHEIARTLDHLERQNRRIVVNKLVLGPEPARTELEFQLAEKLGLPVHRLDLADVLQFDGGAPDAPLQWKLLHTIGATLRTPQ